METLAHWTNDLLLWVGFGTMAGLIAKAVLPGKDSGGTVATLLVGIGGTVIGSGVFSFFWAGQRLTPLSPLGFVAAVLGAAVLLGFHRLLSGRLFREQGTGTARHSAHARRAKKMVVLTKE